MTRTECEKQVLNKMLEIKEILAEYSHNNDSVMIFVGQKSVWASRTIGILNGNFVRDIDICEWCDEVKK